MSFPAFGPGIAIVTRTDVAAGTPIGIGFGQSLTLNDKQTNKPLFGQSKYAKAIGQGTRKTSGKFVAAMLSGLAANSIYYGQTFGSGGVIWNINEANTIPETSTFTIQPTNHATIDSDLGMIYQATALPLVKVASGPITGQYSYSAGTYTFAAADKGLTVLITYRSTTMAGQTLGVTNSLIGGGPTFQLDYFTSTNTPTAKPFIARLYYCVASSHDMDFKLEDFMMPSFEFDYAELPNGKIYDLVYPEVS